MATSAAIRECTDSHAAVLTMPLREIATLLHADAEAIQPFHALFHQAGLCQLAETLPLAASGATVPNAASGGY